MPEDGVPAEEGREERPRGRVSYEHRWNMRGVKQQIDLGLQPAAAFQLLSPMILDAVLRTMGEEALGYGLPLCAERHMAERQHVLLLQRPSIEAEARAEAVGPFLLALLWRLVRNQVGDSSPVELRRPLNA